MQGHDTERYKIDDWTYEVTCLQCGKKFESRRNDATFCSAKHRVAFGKEPQKRLNALKSIKDDGHRLINMAEKYKRDNEVFEAMKQLRDRLNYALSVFEK